MSHRPLCRLCGRNPVKKKTGKGRIGKFKTMCATCDNNRRGYKAHRKETCEKCGFVPEHRCQLQVDHIDGNHDNNAVENLQTLCANCHALKTFINRESGPRHNRPKIDVQVSLTFD